MSAFPPHRAIPSVPISQDIALKFLSSYLEATKTSPHLLPNARLESSGPTAGSSASSVTIHNLKRVEAGLRGEWLAPTLDFEESKVTIAEGMDDGTNKGQNINEEAEGEGWMDLDEYQRGQSIEGGEIGERLPGFAELGDSDFDVNPPKAKKIKLKHNDTPAKTPAKVSKPIDKEARKREKKERLKRERRLKEAQKHQ
ncbi:hypothetical protein NA56DRAFT_563666 [Hyaloscypha hepaticicola]|uniref:Uncharacterized protein n=1 Tax=Hyaloscypha hepaticicola TaxID=2082293 RepID=A0A2J6QII0_9HELO|nr:hypothetical protein NA56DRAFT_563666 [Hyaloscypha hepaticicola]